MTTDVNCANCTTHYYDPSLSQTAIVSPDYTINSMQYGAQKFTGSMMNDDVCLSNYLGGNLCAFDFPIFVANEAVDMKKGFDGVLGLAPNSYQNGPSFIKKLADLGTIPKAVVSYQITPTENKM